MKQILFHDSLIYSMMAVLQDGLLSDFLVQRKDEMDPEGCIYKGKVQSAVPSLNGVFLDIGLKKNAFLRWNSESGPLPQEGSYVLVQVIKDATEYKGPTVTDEISLPGKYSVLIPHSSYIGISRKISSEAQRGFLRRLAKEFRPEGCGLIFRTASKDGQPEEIKKDLSLLVHDWEILQKRYQVQKKQGLLHRSDDLLVKTFRNYTDVSVDELYTDSRESYLRFIELVHDDSLLSRENIFYYDEEEPLYEHFRITSQIDDLFHHTVALPSGGSLLIEHTEALTTVDVNSGRFVKNDFSHEDLAWITNQEAAREICRQLRLRGIGGMIVVDFLNMKNKAHNQDLLMLLRKEARRDPSRVSVLDMTRLGLVEMTRKRSSLNLWENFFDVCDECKGEGIVPSVTYAAAMILDDLKRRYRKHKLAGDIAIECSSDVAHALNSAKFSRYLAECIPNSVEIRGDASKKRLDYAILLNE